MMPGYILVEDIFDEMSQNISYIKLNCYLKVATGYDKPPQELINLSDKYIPLNDLPTFLKKIDNEIEM